MINRLNTILLIDDDNITNYINTRILKKLDGAEKIIAFENGIDGLNFLKKNIEEVDLIFLDINMPGMDGWEFLDEYKKLNISKKIIIIMLTASMNPRDKAKAADIEEVNAYLTKPLQTDSLQEILQKYFQTN